MNARLAGPKTRLVTEAGGWLRVEQPRADLNGACPSELLLLAHGLGGNFRYAYGESSVLLVGELRSPDVEFALDDAHARVLRFLEGLPSATVADDDSLETALAATGRSWSRRDSAWVVPPEPGTPHELRVRIDERGVRVESLLASCADLEDISREALAVFLCRCHLGFRFARAELESSSIHVVSRVEEPDYLETELFDALASVAFACRFLAREAEALQSEVLARAYLDAWQTHQPESVPA